MNVWADFVPVTEAVLLRVVPSAAVTWPRMVTVQTCRAESVPALQVTRFPLGPPWVQAPLELVIVSWGRAGGLWMTPTPLTWSVMTTLSTLALPRLVTTMVYVSSAPEATGFALAVLTTLTGLTGSASTTEASPGWSTVPTMTRVPISARSGAL